MHTCTMICMKIDIHQTETNVRYVISPNRWLLIVLCVDLDAIGELIIWGGRRGLNLVFSFTFRREAPFGEKRSYILHVLFTCICKFWEKKPSNLSTLLEFWEIYDFMDCLEFFAYLGMGKVTSQACSKYLSWPT